jgi:hypothetical protein
MKHKPFKTNADLRAMNRRDLDAWMKRAAQINKHECVRRARIEIEARYSVGSDSYFTGDESEEFRRRVLRMVAGCREHHPSGVEYLRRGLRSQKATAFIGDMVREVTGGFRRMIESGRTDDTAEAVALAFPERFDDGLRAIAGARLIEFDPVWAKDRGLL